MSKYKRIPVSTARKIAKDFDHQQVIIVSWNKEHGQTCVVTYGNTVEACDQAAIGGSKVKKVLGWPESLCNAEPPRIVALKKKVKSLKAQLNTIKELRIHIPLHGPDTKDHAESSTIIDLFNIPERIVGFWVEGVRLRVPVITEYHPTRIEHSIVPKGQVAVRIYKLIQERSLIYRRFDEIIIVSIAEAKSLHGYDRR